RIHKLLARGRLGGPTREKILDHALREAGIVRPPWYARAPFVWTMPAAAAAAVATFALILRPVSDSMRPKGVGAAGAAIVSVECSGLEVTRCTHDDMLLFRVEGATQPAHVVAYADPVGGGQRIWFFPMADGTEPVVHAQQEPQVLGQGVKVRS